VIHPSALPFLLLLFFPLVSSCHSSLLYEAYFGPELETLPKRCPADEVFLLEQAAEYEALGYKPEAEEIREAVRIEAARDTVSRAVISYSTEIKQSKHLHLQDAKVLFTPSGPKICLEYISQDNIYLGSARMLLVDVVEGLMRALAEGTDFPAAVENIELYIDFESYQGIYVDPFFIGYIWLQDAISHFYAFDTKNRDLDIWHTRVEAYYKSRAFVSSYREAEEKQEISPVEPKVRALAEEEFAG